MTLPPLPEPHLLVFDAALQSPIDGWTRSQVEAYARAAVEADRAERSLSGDSAAGVGVTNPFVLHAVGTLREEIERLRDLLRACVPELLGENWQETRYCTHCRSYDGHTDGCLITRIEREVT